MADQKYADLPGIVYDQPDVYETTDLPEADQMTDFYEEENDNIERIEISASEAFNKFKDKYVSGQNVNFSDGLRKNKTGYDARSGDWELINATKDETPLQKYNRLKCEMQELCEEVENLKKNIQGDTTTDCVPLAQNLKETLNELLNLRLEENLQTEIVSILKDPHSHQVRKLISQLEQFNHDIKDTSSSASDLKPSDDFISYQLKYRPEQIKLTQISRLSELEQRVHLLETVLGSTSDKLSRLSSATNQTSLLESAQYLSSKTSLLQSSQLDHIEGRLTALAQKMNHVAQTRATRESDPEKDQKINELYNMMKKNEYLSELLPQTIERLVALEVLWQNASYFSSTLSQIESLQSQISNGVENNKVLLQGVQESFALNLSTIHKNIETLDSRIKALTNK